MLEKELFKSQSKVIELQDVIKKIKKQSTSSECTFCSHKNIKTEAELKARIDTLMKELTVLMDKLDSI
jgi:transposase-like protein